MRDVDQPACPALAVERISYRKIGPEDQQQQDGNNSAGNAKGFGHENNFSTLQTAMETDLGKRMQKTPWIP